MENTNSDDNVVKINLQELAEKENQEREEGVHKVDLSKPPGAEENTDENTNVEEIDENTDESADEPGDGVDDNDADDDASDADDDQGDDSTLSEITDEEEDEEEEDGQSVQDNVQDEEEEDEVVEDKVVLPENIQKLVDFMNDTNGSIEDYVMLNKDIDSMNDDQLLKEYHQTMEPGLDSDEIDFLMEDLYNTDEDLDSERDIKKKSIARKRDISKAKKHLNGLKDKYYDEIKAGSKLNPEQKKAVDFLIRYNTEQEESSKTKAQRSKVFTQKSDKVFGEEFKGFEFKVGEKRYRYNVKNAAEVKSAQSDINNFTKKYLGDDNTLQDAKGYHKALFTAMNADAIADHFYKQGQADAIKSSAKKAKNINMDARGVHNKIQNQTGLRAKVVESDSSPGKLRIKS